ncbi:elongin-A isoform X2 [Xenopus laevis]|uniref:Elongin-A isoform X2 n=1 Tax=Xenopus laevis TaxID=8355 RepID=A0A8J0U608_XENLA|nr:elongin-A isoform X2 [Xenopus laevis]
MAESVLEVVEKLQSRLSPSAEPRKETGIGKTVNSLRKHEFVGDLAKNLVAQWKKLVPQETPRATEPEEREHNKNSVKKRPRSPSPRYDEEEEYEEEISPVYHSDARHRQLVEPQTEFRKEEKRLRHCSDHEDSDNGQAYSPEPSYSPPITYKDRSSQKPSKDHKSSHKEKHGLQNREINPEKKKDKIHQWETEKESTSSAGMSREKLLSPLTRDQTCKKEKNRHSESRGDSVDPVNAKKHSHQDKSKHEKYRVAADIQDTERGKRQVERDPESTSEKGEKNKGKSGTQEKKAIKLFVPSSGPDMEDEFEKPTMSFESYLSYDQPQKKKKKTAVKTVAAEPEKTKKKQSNKRPDNSRSNDLPKNKIEAPNKDVTTKKKESSLSTLSKIDQVPVLPDIPLPLIQPNYRPLPSIEPVVFSPNKRKAPLMSALEEEESAGFTGRRFNSKMQVYSGSKTAYLPKMMSLYEQCIRVLANNIDSIYEVGGVPFSVLEPVLEKCTPDQLCRIEECNHVLVEDTDQIWFNHCQRDFKKDKPEEYESWRELYLRLQDAREQRLRMLTQNIRSSHANKPKGRQAKMAFVNSAVKPPRDVRRRQEKFGTGKAEVNEKCRIKPFVPISSTSYTSNHGQSEEQMSYEAPSTSNAVSSPISVQPSYDSRKPQVKKVAPMMAKTIKAFKNRFFRR